MPLRLVSKEEWGARKPLFQLPLPTPVANVVLKYFTLTIPCTGDDQCFDLLRRLQAHGIDMLGFPDIEYNFLVGGDGTVYEGRGWQVKSNSYHEYDEKSIDIAYIGDFRKAPDGTRRDPPPEMVQGFKDVVQYGIDNNYILPDYKHHEIRAWDWSIDYGFRSPLEDPTWGFDNVSIFKENEPTERTKEYKHNKVE